MFKRHIVREGGMARPSVAGDGLAANFIPNSFAAETDETITISELEGGHLIQGTTLSSDVVYTLPTSALIAAAALDMNNGDSFSFVVTNAQAGAFDVVIAVGTDTTKVGANSTLSVPPQASRIFTLVMTDDTDGAETFDLY